MILIKSNEAFNAGWSQKFSSSEDRTQYSITECALLRVTYDYLTKTYPSLKMPTITTSYGKCEGALVQIGKAIKNAGLNIYNYRRFKFSAWFRFFSG